jgi:hypothetical protein
MYLNYFGTLQTVSWETNIAENVLVSPGSMDPKKINPAHPLNTKTSIQYPIWQGGKGAVGGVMAVRLLRLLEPRAEAPLPH